MKTNLKPCPFCGGKAKAYGGGYSQESPSVRCTNCCVTLNGRFSLKQDDVIHQWNTRKDLRAIPGDIPLHMNVNLVILIAFLLWVIFY